MSSAGPAAIILKKKRRRHHDAHHGGAWKVAYADFVTALMAFFLVMWLVGQSTAVRQSIAAYFRDPGAFEQVGRGVLPGAESGTDGGGLPAKGSVEEAEAILERAAEQLREMLRQRFASLQDRIDVRVTDEGLLIELREAPNDGFFATGSAVAKPETTEVLTAIAAELGQLPNAVAVEGHTDSRAYAAVDGYGNWDLSADRANTARRIMERRGLREGQVEAVRGYADTRLRLPRQPLDAGNRRISIVVRRNSARTAKGPNLSPGSYDIR
jgi:chemotaxis protein MotB